MKQSATPMMRAGLMAACLVAALGLQSTSPAYSAPASHGSSSARSTIDPLSLLPAPLRPDYYKLLRRAGLSRQQVGTPPTTTGDTGVGAGPGQQFPRDVDITFIANSGAPGNTNQLSAPPKSSLAPYIDKEPVFAPDLNTVYFASDRPVAGLPAGFHLFTMQSDGSYQKLLTGTVGTDQEYPSFSPEGNRIVYTSRDIQGVAQLHILDLSVPTLPVDHQITSGSGDKTHPSWSKSTLIVFQDNEVTPSNLTGQFKLWLVLPQYGGSLDSTASPRAQMTGVGVDAANAADEDTSPAWEPSNQHIAFVRFDGNHHRIWLISNIFFSAASGITTSPSFQLTDFQVAGVGSDEQDPTWRPQGGDYLNPIDGDLLAFASTRKSSVDPTTIEQGATSVGMTYGIYRMPILYQDQGEMHPYTETQAVAQGAAHAVVVAEDTQHPPFSYNNVTPAWSPREEPDPVTGLIAVANRIFYSSDNGQPYSTSTVQYISPYQAYDIWSTEVTDFTPPVLTAIPTVRALDVNGQVTTEQVTAPGRTVQFKVHAVDLNSGIAHIYVQIKNPNSYLQDNSLPSLRNSLDGTLYGQAQIGGGPQPLQTFPPLPGAAPGPPNTAAPGEVANPVTSYDALIFDGHRIYGIYEERPNVVATVVQWVTSHVDELGYQPINPQTYSYSDGGQENLPFDLYTYETEGHTVLTSPDFQPPDTLELVRSTDPNDQPDTFVQTWVTDAAHATDYYVDVITVDKVGNSTDYDNVSGFSTKPFGTTGSNSILLVADYTSPQIFIQARGAISSVLPVGAEAFLTDDPQGKVGTQPSPIGNSGNIAVMNQVEPGAAAPTDVLNGFIWGNTNTLGTGSWVDCVLAGTSGSTGTGMASYSGEAAVNAYRNRSWVTLHEWPSPENAFDPSVNLDGYDIWRILSRGPISSDVLATYGPQTIVEPNPADISTTRTRKASQRCVVWASPYTADEYVGPGTIIDPAAQATINNFVAAGGHIFLTGQDIAWALSVNNPNYTPGTAQPGAQFLHDTFGVQFSQDFIQQQDARITHLAGPIGARWATPLDNIYTFLWFQAIFGAPAPISNDVGWASSDNEFPDKVVAATGATPVGVTVAGDYTNSVFSTTNSATGSKTVYASFGIEGIDQNVTNLGPLDTNPLVTPPVSARVADFGSENNRSILMHGIVCWLRNTTATGQVAILEPNGRLQPVPNVLIEAVDNKTQNVDATALSDAQGNYTLAGIPTGDNPEITRVGGIGDASTVGSLSRTEADGLDLSTATRPGYSQAHLEVFVGGHAGQISHAQQLLAVAPPGVLQGKVTDSLTGLPIAGVTVTVTNTPFTDISLTTTTDANGNYTFANVPALPTAAPGQFASSYIITYAAPNYTTVTINGAIVPSGGTLAQNITLTPAAGTLTVTVLDPNNNPVANATVTATPSLGVGAVVLQTTDATGKATFTGLVEGTYVLTATAAGFAASLPTNQTLGAGQIASITLVLQPSGATNGGTNGTTTGTTNGTDTITGTITFISGAPSAGTTVTLTNSATNAVVGTTQTSNLGVYNFTGLAAGTYVVTVTAPGQTTNPTGSVTLSAAQPAATLNFTIGTGAISGVVTFAATGSPASGIAVTLTNSATNAITTTQTDGQGAYSFGSLQAGTYVVTVTAPGQTTTPTSTITLTAAQPSATLNFTVAALYTFPQGVSMVSVPYDYSGTSADAQTIFNVSPISTGIIPIATYDPTINQYDLYPNLPGSAGTQTVPGRGYWIKETAPQPFVNPSLPAGQTIKPITGTFQENLSAGWNMIGDPYTVAVDWNLVQVQVPLQIGTVAANTPVTMQIALVNHIVTGSPYAFSVTQDKYLQTTTLLPFQGYWIFVNPAVVQGQQITLIFNQPS